MSSFWQHLLACVRRRYDKIIRYYSVRSYMITLYSKPCVKRPLPKRPKIDFQDHLSRNAGQKYCRMLSWSILQYFLPSLSYHWPLSYLFCLFFSGRFTQVLLYIFKGLFLSKFISAQFYQQNIVFSE